MGVVCKGDWFFFRGRIYKFLLRLGIGERSFLKEGSVSECEV